MILLFLLIPIDLHLLVEGLGVRGGGRDVRVTGSLVGAGGELELVGRLQVGIAGGAVGGGVILEVEKKGEHSAKTKRGQKEVKSAAHLTRVARGTIEEKHARQPTRESR